MKIRVGYGLGTRSESNDPERLDALIDGLEARGFDSLWFSERVTGTCPDPVVAMSYAAGRTTKLKFGMSVMVLPGRNPAILAKTMASLDRVSGGRLLPAFGLGAADSVEHQAFGVEKTERGGWFNEAMPLMKRFWTEEHVTHEGKRFTVRDVNVKPKPLQSPLEVWLGGSSPLELKRVARHADGWLPSFCTAGQVAEQRKVIESHLAEFEREIEDEHYGALVVYRPEGTDLPAQFAKAVEVRQPGGDPDEIVPPLDRLPEALGRFIDVGFSKFVVVPAAEPADWDAELQAVAEQVKPLEN